MKLFGSGRGFCDGLMFIIGVSRWKIFDFFGNDCSGFALRRLIVNVSLCGLNSILSSELSPHPAYGKHKLLFGCCPVVWIFVDYFDFVC